MTHSDAPAPAPAPAPESAPGPVASTALMLARGASRRCPRCGAGHLFSAWFRMVGHCPGCGYTFAREDGYFLGAFVINFGVTIAGLAVFMGILIAVLAAGGHNRAIETVAALAAFEAVLVPIAFYPFSKTLWAGIDLAMHRGEAWAAPRPGRTLPSP